MKESTSVFRITFYNCHFVKYTLLHIFCDYYLLHRQCSFTEKKWFVEIYLIKASDK